jgi:hypothetical protein
VHPGVKKEDYAFTVKARGETWDCYHFKKDGKDGTLGFTKRGESFVIGMFTAGHLTRKQAIKALEAAVKKDEN